MNLRRKVSRIGFKERNSLLLKHISYVFHYVTNSKKTGRHPLRLPGFLKAFLIPFTGHRI